MADWSKLKEEILADGKIDASETERLRAQIYADGKVDREEVMALADLRRRAKSVSPEFTNLFFEALQKHILDDGRIDADEAALLREIIFADGVVDEDEKNFLRALKDGATDTSQEFQALFDECMK